MTELTQYIPDEGTMLRFGKKLAEVLVKQPKDNAIVLYFNGDLGAGKTTLTRGMVQGLGYQGNVKSPTYTLVEEYSIAGKSCRRLIPEQPTIHIHPENSEDLFIRSTVLLPGKNQLFHYAESGARHHQTKQCPVLYFQIYLSSIYSTSHVWNNQSSSNK